MLARAPQNFPECFKLSIKPSKTPRLFELFCSRSAGKHGLRCCDFSRRRTIWPKKRVSVRACYTRKQLETPGAYQLINDETGEKVIVWGDADDDSPIPSDDVLSWNPKTKSSGTSRKEDTKKKTTAITNANEGGVKADAAVNNSGEPLGGSARSFGRLKAQRVRTLIDKSSRVKQENVEYDTGESVLEDTPFDKAVSSDLEVEYVVRKSYVGAVRHRGSISKASQSQETKDTTFDKTVSSDSEVKYVARKSNVGAVRHRGSISKASLSQETKDTPFDKTVSSDSEVELVARKSNVGAVRYRGNISKASYSLETKDKMQASKQEVPTSRSVAATRRGWGNGKPTQSTRFDSIDVLNQRRKRFSNDGFFSRKSFRDLGCSDDMIESLRGQLFLRPSHIQAMAFVPVNEGKSCIIADQSGSGKTLAYLAPVIQRLRQEELQGVGRSSPRSPRVIVLVPTAELASQVLSNCRSISKYGVPFRSMVATGGFRQRTQLENLQQNLDVLIATPGRFIFLLKEGFLQLTNLMCAVLDEVDILFGDEEFEQALQSLISSAPMTTQYLFATATLPVEIYNKLVEIFPDCKVIMGPGMHRTSSGLEEILVDCSGDDAAERSPDTAFLNKKAALLQLVEESPVSKTIVFCNKIETCRKVENVLKRFDRKEYRIRVLPFHAALDQELRLANMKDFLNTQSKEDSLFLICTDRASRGIDFVGVDHVVLFDFPRDPSEYVRRVGRTARGAGGVGKAFVFVVGKQVSLARRIIERNKRGHPLHDVPSAYELVG